MPFHRMNESGQKLWEGVVNAVGDKSLNLSLYLNKYVYVDAVKESPTEAKVFAVEVLGVAEDPSRLINELKKFKEDLKRINDCYKFLRSVETAVNLVSIGEFKRASQELERITKNRYCKKELKRRRIYIPILPTGESTPRVIIGSSILREYSARYLKTYRKLAERTFELKTKTRLVVGLGEGGTYETGIALLRNYGIPYIPGTAIKGVTKHYAVERLVEKYGNSVFDILGDKTGDKTKQTTEGRKGESEEFDEDIFSAMKAMMLALEEELDEKKKKESPLKEFLQWEIPVNGETIKVSELREMFGTTKSEGKIVFLDALPLPLSFNDWELMEWDIMNPHYGPYYQSGEAPGDWHNPNPIKFLTVKPETKFLFGLRKSKTRTGDCDDLLGKAKALLKEALKNHGVGAKTSLGYGRFE